MRRRDKMADLNAHNLDLMFNLIKKQLTQYVTELIKVKESEIIELKSDLQKLVKNIAMTQEEYLEYNQDIYNLRKKYFNKSETV
jgi:hypothetical protein